MFSGHFGGVRGAVCCFVGVVTVGVWCLYEIVDVKYRGYGLLMLMSRYRWDRRDTMCNQRG